MLNEPTMQKLLKLRLTAFAAAWAEQQKNPDVNKLSFDERIGLLVDAEHLARENARIARSLREAKLRMNTACIEDIDYGAKRELDKGVVRCHHRLLRVPFPSESPEPGSPCERRVRSAAV